MSGGSDGLVRAWEFDDGKLEGTLPGHRVRLLLPILPPHPPQSEVIGIGLIDALRVAVTVDAGGSVVFWTVRPWNAKYLPICSFV